MICRAPASVTICARRALRRTRFTLTTYKTSIIVILVISVSIQTVSSCFVQDRFASGRKSFRDADFQFFWIDFKALKEKKFLLHSVAGTLIAFGMLLILFSFDLCADFIAL